MARTFVHPMAIVDEGAVIGKGCQIWAWSHVRAGAVIGCGTVIAERVSIGPGVRIGQFCKIQNGCDVHEGVTIEDEVFLGPGVQTTNDIMPRARGEWRDRFRPTMIRRQASVGAGAVLVCGIELGEGCMVGAGSVVTHDVEAWYMVRGNPAQRIRRVECAGRVEVGP